jgi:hypothetical protein
MNEFSQPSAVQRWLMVVLFGLLFMSGSTLIYFRTAYSYAPRWTDLMVPLSAALVGLLSLLPGVLHARRIWRFGIAAFYLLLSAVELFLFFN